jgi:hypothetical protein
MPLIRPFLTEFGSDSVHDAENPAALAAICQVLGLSSKGLAEPSTIQNLTLDYACY